MNVLPRIFAIVGVTGNLIVASDEFTVSSTELHNPSPNSDGVMGTSLPTSGYSDTNIWAGDIGEGFKPGLIEAGFNLGVGFGHQDPGTRIPHDFAFAKIHAGRMIGEVKGEGKWYGGNWEILGELLFGAQYNSKSAYVVGLTPMFRYNFSTGTRWVPYVDAGFGVTATDIGLPELGTTFQFNSQFGFGVQRFVGHRLAVDFQYRFLHLSNAGIQPPNTGVNASLAYVGLIWAF